MNKVSIRKALISALLAAMLILLTLIVSPVLAKSQDVLTSEVQTPEQPMTSGNWVLVGAAGFSAGETTSATLALDKNDTPYVAYSDQASGGKATVKKFNGTAWVNVGSAGFSADTAYGINLAWDNSNMPYVAYYDMSNGSNSPGRAIVMKYTSTGATGWVPVGPAGSLPNYTSGPLLALDNNGNPYVFYKVYSGPQPNGPGVATVMKYTGATWVSVGSAGFTSTYISGMALGSDNTPYVAFVDGLTHKATVMKYTGAGTTGWVLVGPASFSADQVQHLELALDKSNMPYVVYVDAAATPTKVTMMKFNGAAWSTVGSSDLGGKETIRYKFIMDRSNLPYLLCEFDDPNNNHEIELMKWNGSAWDLLGVSQLGINDGILDLALDGNNTPYMAYEGFESSNKLTVKKFIPAPQVTTIAATGMTTKTALLSGKANGLNASTVTGFEYGLTTAYGSSVSASPSPVTGSSNTPVSATATGLIPNKTYHFRLVGTSAGGTTYGSDMTFTTLMAWGQNVGTAGFSAGQADNVDLALDKSNTPYVAYSDASHGGKATVMKFNGAAWINVGSSDFSAGQALGISLALDSNNMPYVAYGDGGNGGKVTVMKYTGAAWVNVGPAGFSTNLATYASLALDGNNMPYVAYGDEGGYGGITVMKFTGATWVSTGFTNSGLYARLTVDNTGKPYLAYAPYWGLYQDNYHATVVKYNGATWATVGPGSASSNPAGYLDLGLDSSNTPYVAYDDVYYTGTGGHATVMKYNGAAWTIVGIAGFSADEVSHISLAIDKNKTPYVAYSDWGNSKRATVMRFNGTAWETVGLAAFSAGQADSTSLALDSGNTAYVAFSDAANGGKATVMKMVLPFLALNKAGPLNTASWLATNPTLSWGVSNITASYEYCYDTTNNNACDTGWKSAGTNTSVALTGLKKGTTYYWQVRAVNSSGMAYADANAWWSFSTGASTTIYLPFVKR